MKILSFKVKNEEINLKEEFKIYLLMNIEMYSDGNIIVNNINGEFFNWSKILLNTENIFIEGVINRW